MKLRFKHRCWGGLLLAFGSALCLPAQDGQQIPAEQDLVPNDASIANDTSATPYQPLTLEGKFKYSLNKVFGFPGLLALGVHASLDQVDKTHGWGSGTDAYGVRLASRLGRSLVYQSLAFGVRAVDHEDPRYFVSGRGGPLRRVRYAMVHTFVVHNDNGGMMPAYSRFVATLGMPFIGQQWWAGQFRTVPEGFRQGAVGLGVGVGMNIGREFWPDIRMKLQETRLGRRFVRFIPNQN